MSARALVKEHTHNNIFTVLFSMPKTIVSARAECMKVDVLLDTFAMMYSATEGIPLSGCNFVMA